MQPERDALLAKLRDRALTLDEAKELRRLLESDLHLARGCAERTPILRTMLGLEERIAILAALARPTPDEPGPRAFRALVRGAEAEEARWSIIHHVRRALHQIAPDRHPRPAYGTEPATPIMLAWDPDPEW